VPGGFVGVEDALLQANGSFGRVIVQPDVAVRIGISDTRLCRCEVETSGDDPD
jgi:hypothetical protein